MQRILLGAFIIQCFILVRVTSFETFSSIGKYDYGIKGVLLNGVEIELIDQEGPGTINIFQFATDFEGYEEVYDIQNFPNTKH